MIEATRAAVIGAFLSGWTGAAAIPVGLPNQALKVPASGAYGRLTLQLGDRSSAAIGACRVRMIGVLFLQVFTPEGQGIRAAARAADLFSTIFDLKTIAIDAGLVAVFSHVGSNGTGNREGIEQTNVTVDFRVDLTT
jgi:hypothetical protein